MRASVHDLCNYLAAKYERDGHELRFAFKYDPSDGVEGSYRVRVRFRDDESYLVAPRDAAFAESLNELCATLVDRVLHPPKPFAVVGKWNRWRSS